MKVFIIGGTGLIGPHVAARLTEGGADVRVLNRRGISPARGCSAIAGDRQNTQALRSALREFEPDVAIDMIPFCRADAEGVIAATAGFRTKWVCISSIDVYVAYARLHRTEPGPIIEGLITEDCPLRTRHEEKGYDKLSVEQVMMRKPRSGVSILRLPMVYGPPDMRRVGSYVKRMLDRRPRIALGRSFAQWKVSRVAATDCAGAIVLCALSEHEGLRIFNVAAQETYSEREWVQLIGRHMEWEGSITELDDSVCPPPHGIDTRQHMVISSDKIRAQLGFHETELAELSVASAVRWARESLASGSHHEQIDYQAEDELLRHE